MKNRIMNKLRSNSGASITFALLLFLVCAVLCSVIIVAASASSGRMSKISESDQKYFAVTSAADLMKDLIDGQIVTIEKVTNCTKTETYTGSTINASITDDGDDYELYVNGNKIDIHNPEFSVITDEAAYRYFLPSDVSASNPNSAGTFTLKPASSLGDNTDYLDVQISLTVDGTGNMTLIIGNDYKLRLEFGAVVTGPTISEKLGEVNNDTTAGTIKTKIKKTETTTIKWAFTGIYPY